MKLTKLMASAILLFSIPYASADRLVIMHTNDVHGNVRPDRPKDRGGMLRAKVAIDSIRRAEEHTLLLDAGDDVQGRLYFTLFGGRVEYEMMNRMGYEITTIGNHEFDNGLDSLQRNYSILKAAVVNANYDFSGTPLEGRIQPYAIREYDGKRIAVIGVGASPEGLIVDKNFEGVGYKHPYRIADNIAARLKANRQADYAIVLSHIGYSADTPSLPCDTAMAKATSHIDLIIGGHSHTEIDPQKGNIKHIFTNAASKQVLVAQTGSQGASIGKITVDLDNPERIPDYELIPVDNRYDSRIDPETELWLKPYDTAVDALMQQFLIPSDDEMPHGSQELNNWVADMLFEAGSNLTKHKIDAAITNSGGIRRPLPKGQVSYGNVMTIVPFENSVLVVEMDGKNLQSCLDEVVATGGQAVSKQLSFAADKGKAADVRINGKPLDPNATYRIATIDFVANGGDHLASFRNAKIIAKSDSFMKMDFINLLKKKAQKGEKIKADKTERIYHKN